MWEAALSLPHCWINETVLNFRDLIKAARVININLLKLFHLVQGICILWPYNFFFFFPASFRQKKLLATAESFPWFFTM